MSSFRVDVDGIARLARARAGWCAHPQTSAVESSTDCPRAPQSATYLLDRVSEPAATASTLPPRTTSPPSTPGVEQGHSDAVWCAKWARTADGGQVVVTGSADHSLKLWCARSQEIDSTAQQADEKPANSLQEPRVANSADTHPPPDQGARNRQPRRRQGRVGRVLCRRQHARLGHHALGARRDRAGAQRFRAR